MSNPYLGGSPGAPNTTRSGAPGLMQRRSSYASVAAGTASQPSQPIRSGAFSHLLNDTSDSYDPIRSGTNPHAHRLEDGEMSRNGRGPGRESSYYGYSGQLPSFSSAFGMFTNGHGHSGFGPPLGDEMFIPSYLRRSKHVRNLQESQKARAKARHDAPSSSVSQGASLSTSSSSANMYGKPPSHRGMTFELIEKAPPVDDESLAPLPSRWNAQDKYGGLDILSEGQEVKFTGPKQGGDRDHEACSIRADHYMPPQCGIYYYEVTILSRKREEYA